MELSHPVLHLTRNTDVLHTLHNKCYIILLSHQDSLGLVEMVANKMSHKPSLVIYIDFLDLASVNSLGVHHEPWARYVPGSQIISMTCAGDGIVRRGLLFDLHGSLGNVEEACSLRGKELRIAHNMLPPYFAVYNGTIDQTTLESQFLQSFIEKFSLRPTFLFAQQTWGSRNKTSGIWNGIVGLVGKIILFPGCFMHSREKSRQFCNLRSKSVSKFEIFKFRCT